MNYIFDFDGTLCDSLDVTLDIINKYFRLFHIREVTETEMRTIGLKGMLAARHIPSLIALFGYPIAHMEFTRRLPQMQLFDWTRNIIPQLDTKHTLGILTNNSPIVVSHVLEQHQLKKHFQFVVSQPSLFAKKQTLETLLVKYRFQTEDTYYIGDGIRDIEAAHAVGIKSIGVAWGLESDALLASAHPTRLISQPSELLTL